MAIKSIEKDGKLILEIDNGDLEKLKQCMSEWSFRDNQSLIRFAISIMLVTEGKNLWIKQKGRIQQIVPSDEFLRESGDA